jgi:hypothetical protein
MADDFSPWERETLEVFLVLGHEVAGTALALRADYVSAHLRLDANFEVELSRLPEW